jgi:hypothetical protein
VTIYYFIQLQAKKFLGKEFKPPGGISGGAAENNLSQKYRRLDTCAGRLAGEGGAAWQRFPGKPRRHFPTYEKLYFHIRLKIWKYNLAFSNQS